jgi:hypothetical protein
MAEGIQHLGRIFLVMGIVFAVIGIVLLLSHKMSWLGSLPGNILIQRKNFTLYFPLATSILISLLLTLLLRLFGRR